MIYWPLQVPEWISVFSAISLMSQAGHSSVLVVEACVVNIEEKQLKQLKNKKFCIDEYQRNKKFPSSALLGIFTQSDVVHLVATGRLNSHNLTIGEVMTSPVITLNLSDSTKETSEIFEENAGGEKINHLKKQANTINDQALFLFDRYDINHIPVLDNDQNIIGIIDANKFLNNYIISKNNSPKTPQLINHNSQQQSDYQYDEMLDDYSLLSNNGSNMVSFRQKKPNKLADFLLKIPLSFIFWEYKKNIADEKAMLMAIDREGNIAVAEGKILVKGWHSKSLVGKNLFELNLDESEAIAQLRQILTTGENIETIERLSVLFLSESAEVRFYKWKYSPLTNYQDQLVGGICVVTDITKGHKTEAELRSLFRAMTDLVFIINSEGRYLNIAPTNSKLLYKSSKEVVGKTLSEVLPAATADLIFSQIQVALTQQETVTVEYSLQIQGREVWFDGRISPFLESSVILVARDISDRVKIEQYLKQSQEFFHQIINATPDPIFVKDHQHKFMVVNDALCRLIGHERKQIIGRSDPDFFPQEQVDVFWEIDRQVLETGLPYKIEERLTDALGNVHVISTKKTRFEDANKNKFLVGTIRDITAKVKISEALKRSEERYRAFIDQSSEGICCWEFEPPISLDQPESDRINQILHNGYIVECNDVMAQMYGLESASETIGTPMSQWRDPNQPENIEQLRGLIRSGYRLNNVESKICNSAKSYQYFLHNMVGIIEDGCLQRLWMTQLDISDRRLTRIALEKSEARYRGIIESQQDLIVRIDLAGCLTFVNDAYCGKFGRSAAELLGQNYLATVYEEDRTATLEAMELLKYPPYRMSLEHRAWTAQGCRWIVWENYAIHNEEGMMMEIQAVGRDISDRKETELALRESENFLELFFSQSLEGFFFMMLDSPVEWNDTVDKEKVLDYVFAHQRITKVNNAMLGQYKATREEFIGRTPNDLFAHNLPYGRKLWRRFFDRGKLQITTDERHMDVSQLWIEGEYICLYDDQGRIKGHFGVQRDISDRYHAEAALRESEQRFRQIAENSQEILWISSADRQKMLYVNPAYETISGYSCQSLYEDALGWIDKIIHPDDQYRVLGTVMQQMLESQQVEIEYRIIRPDGKIRWLWERIFAICNEQGKVYRQAGLVSDITQRKEMEETLRLTQERLGYLITTNPAVIYSLEAWGNCRITFISENVKTLLGYDPEQFIENPGFWIEHIHPEDLPHLSSSIELKWELDQSISHEYRFLCARGNYRWMRDENRLLLDEEGNPLEVVGYLADITERKQAENEIRKSIKKERDLNSLKSRFITMISHEFRTPLATILSSADLLELYTETSAVEKSRQHIERIQSAAEHMTNMLNDILDLAHAETRQQYFQSVVVDLAAFCREMISEMKTRYSFERAIWFICTPESEDQLSNALVDTTLLRQILINLLSNAIKYSGLNAKVELQLICPQQMSEKKSASSSKVAILQVKDTGFGIEPEEQSRIFDAFYRGNNIENIPGTGLGLAIVKHAVDLHGGKITLDSTLGVGSTFTVTLPLTVDW